MEQDESATLRILQQTQLEEEGMQKTHQPQASSHGHLGEVWKPGDDGPILARVGGANLPADGGGTASNN